MDYLLTFKNTHDALLCEKRLVEAELSVVVRPLPSVLGKFCGICLQIEPQQFLQANAIILKKQLAVEKIFIIEQNENERTYQLWNP